MRFSGRTIIVTGGASGIGAATVERFHSEGAHVIIADLDLDLARRTMSELGDERLSAFPLDVTDDASVKALFDAVDEEAGGPADILVNSAGIREIVPAMELPLSVWDGVMSVNLRGTFHTAQLFAQRLIAEERTGSVVNVSSTSSILAVRDRAAYVASKHGVSGLTKELALELGPRGIRVNAVAPSVTRTPLTAEYFTDPVREAEHVARYPLGRIGVAEDVASAIAFFASDDAGFITGTILPVDGGYSAGRF